MKKFVSLLLSVLVTTGCASYPVNPPLTQIDSPDSYSFNNLKAVEGKKENFVIVSFSGGGIRAASLAYGVLKQLRDTEIDETGKTLLDEINVISSASGGSLASAYYGLYGQEKFFQDFREEVLYRKIATNIFARLFLPWNMWKLGSYWYARSDLGADYLDKKIFKGHTFRDMPREWPFIVISSSDMSRGSSFTFTQEDFNRLCSDLNEVKISRAVMTSMAFPGPFTPLTYKNYPKSQCGYTSPAWVGRTLAKEAEDNVQFYHWAENLKSYEDHEERPFIHLYDAGLADNLAIRPAVFAISTDAWDLLGRTNLREEAKRIILIIVDAKPLERGTFDHTARPAKLMSILLTAALRPISNYTVDTIVRLHKQFQELDKANENYELIKNLCGQFTADSKKRQECVDQFQLPREDRVPPYPDLHLIHIRFSELEDKEMLSQIKKIKTSLQLSKEKVNLIIFSEPRTTTLDSMFTPVKFRPVQLQEPVVRTFLPVAAFVIVIILA